MAVSRFRDHWHHVDILDSLWIEMHSVRANSPLRQSAEKLPIRQEYENLIEAPMSDQTWHQKYRSKGAAATGGLGSRTNGPMGRPNELHILWLNGLKEV
ncbi:hypothetical protein N7499_012146 [Penicillium canescens]|uniref:Uncharacterized protein n=1 Tax=Penicillium canescens TaxID=5083 RepID=A0AAD6IFW9_PENCN|nr:uncharacterized protein N7446_003375 [Penicillium canescens]KAJ5996006.1 hypothetical protein N7522_007666 [Penicillium canescens]KAJ6045172.1 hypothetical protein N7460_006527 [Penicillium canescens]KAJ6056642.1 hypothetical protein N7444_005740 [Penicillium canescens]KAJ6066072.1 hypothetical protein N7499_012146 [Penicillium canescens]KAJ6075598.1 hypothetical protein N7446_003375 [Penicillium canescens]